MTDRWLNYVLAVVVVFGLVGVAAYERPRAAEERAAFLDQEVAQVEDVADAPEDRDVIELRPRSTDEVPDRASTSDDGDGPWIGVHGVTSSSPQAVDVGMQVLEAGGNAVDAAVAMAYTLGVAEPFGSGPGGGGAMLVHEVGEEPRYYDYREMAPLSGTLPASNIGVPGFVLGMEHVHDIHGAIELADLIEPAARLAEDGYEVSEYLHDRLRAAGHRLPIHLAPRLFPDGQAIGAGETLRQPEYAQALRLIQAEGASAVYEGELGQQMIDAVNGLGAEDLAAYEVLELDPVVSSFAGYEVVASGVPTSGITVAQMLAIADELGLGGGDLDAPDSYHGIAQAWRAALSDRTEYVADPTIRDVPVDELVAPGRIADIAAAIPPDGFVEVNEEDLLLQLETDTTHVVVVDASGTMVSMTNTLSNFFGSGLPVSGFFMNDQLKNFSREADSVNRAEAGKRPRSFIAPIIVADADRPILGIGSPGGRRIPTQIAEVLIAWANGSDLEAATLRPRFHLEGRRLELETQVDSAVRDDLASRGYEVTTEVPTTEYFGGMQALLVDHDAGHIEGIADERRIGVWQTGERDHD
jgi:gamma-glutamyltranspeptidase / glutathione hydrolase